MQTVLDALSIGGLVANHPVNTLLICQSMQQARQIAAEVAFFQTDDFPIQVFPDWETLPYDHFSPHQDIISERIKTLYQLHTLGKSLTIVAMPTLMHRLAPKAFTQSHSIVFNIGQELDLERFRATLTENAYRIVPQVYEHGECAIRGSIIDIFPTGAQNAYRIDLFDNSIESIRHFDPQTQRSIAKIDRIELLPAKEFPITDSSISRFRQQWRERFSGNAGHCPIYNDISEGIMPAGIEYYLPLFFEQTATLLDYFPSETQILTCPQIFEAGTQFWQEVKLRHEQLNYDITRPILPADDWLMTPDSILGSIKPYQTQALKSVEKLTPKIPINRRLNNPLEHLEDYLNKTQARCCFIAESPGRLKVLQELLENTITLPAYDNWQAYTKSASQYGICIGPLEQGYMSQSVHIIAESQLFGEYTRQASHTSKTQDPEYIIRDLSELRVGAPIVHIEHGIGRYQGLTYLDINGINNEFLIIHYSGEDKIYVPVTSLSAISRYTGSDADNAPLSRLGSEQWQKAKARAKQKIHDVATQLLALYAKREANEGISFTIDSQAYNQFADSFPFEETPDQQQAIHNVLSDMQRIRPMDRLICGDVGFGKTEVAMRAAFVAVQNKKQVAVLVPTTLLAEQHSTNFKDRFANTPIQIACLSRFGGAKAQRETLQKLANGKVDILIGTHKLLQNDVKFANCGLIIIDEEHRFGVGQKERLKQIRSEVDVLSLTATPIPRTLNMTMSGMRDISIITTPPKRRLSIKTFWTSYKPQLVREAVLREILRGGQVFFLHNKVETISQTAAALKTLIPEAKIATAHGQMREMALERVMSDFYHRRYNLLVCTTIIETGIDIPSANTIIIDRADKFGLAQLHQIRGRVGRSHHQAYAYLFTPDKKALTKDALKRLEALTNITDLGAGFMLATHDLEIRGAGELLGEEQSGNMESIGYTLYMDMLNKAVKSLKNGGDITEPSDCEMDLGLSLIIPENTVPDIYLRLNLYKRINSCENNETLKDMQAEFIDRFGSLPQTVKHLFRATEIKLKAQNLGINRVDAKATYIRLGFSEQAKIDPSRLIALIQNQAQIYQLKGPSQLTAKIPSDSADARLDALLTVINTLT